MKVLYIKYSQFPEENWFRWRCANFACSSYWLCKGETEFIGKIPVPVSVCPSQQITRTGPASKKSFCDERPEGSTWATA